MSASVIRSDPSFVCEVTHRPALEGHALILADSERVFVLLDLMERQVKVCLGADALSAA